MFRSLIRQVSPVQIIGLTSEVLSQIHNLLDITICPIVVNKPCVYDFPIVLQVMSIVLQVKTSPAIRLENRIQVICNRLCICDKTSDVDPIICTLATCKQPICTSASPRYRLVVCRWLLYRLLDRRLRFCHRFSQTDLYGVRIVVGGGGGIHSWVFVHKDGAD